MKYPQHDAPSGEHWWQKRVPVISTSHITEEDGLFLVDSLRYPHPAVIDSYSDGAAFLIRLHGDTGGWPHCVSEEFVRLISGFADSGYSWIILDRDGDVIPDLPTFNW